MFLIFSVIAVTCIQKQSMSASFEVARIIVFFAIIFRFTDCFIDYYSRIIYE